MKKIFGLLLVAVTILLTACNKSDLETIKVVATAKPHEEILIAALPLLKEKGYTLDITVISDYSLGNPAVSSNSALVNYFQHIPYLDQYNEKAAEDKKLVNVAAIHIEPYGLYKGSIDTIDELKNGDTIIISDNVADYGRIVNFLKNAELVTTSEDFNPLDALSDPEDAILSKTVNFNFRVIEAALLVTAQKNKEAALFFINGNYAIEGGLSKNDLVLVEPTNNNPYVNILAVKPENKDRDDVKALVEVLTSDFIKDFINDKYNGGVIPV